MVTEPVIHSAPDASARPYKAAMVVVITFGPAVPTRPVALPSPLKSASAPTHAVVALGQSFSNPQLGQTTIAFALAEAADVRLGLFDRAGRKVVGIVRKGLATGKHTIVLNLSGLGLAAGHYHCQLHASSCHGTSHQQKTLTVA